MARRALKPPPPPSSIQRQNIHLPLLKKLSKHGVGGVVGRGTAEPMGSSSVKPGDRVALVYHKSDAIGFI
jgi:hypothetical protein